MQLTKLKNWSVEYTCIGGTIIRRSVLLLWLESLVVAKATTWAPGCSFPTFHSSHFSVTTLGAECGDTASLFLVDFMLHSVPKTTPATPILRRDRRQFYTPTRKWQPHGPTRTLVMRPLRVGHSVHAHRLHRQCHPQVLQRILGHRDDFGLRFPIRRKTRLSHRLSPTRRPHHLVMWAMHRHRDDRGLCNHR